MESVSPQTKLSPSPARRGANRALVIVSVCAAVALTAGIAAVLISAPAYTALLLSLTSTAASVAQLAHSIAESNSHSGRDSRDGR
jgi:hypothetical protein